MSRRHDLNLINHASACLLTQFLHSLSTDFGSVDREETRTKKQGQRTRKQGQRTRKQSQRTKKQGQRTRKQGQRIC